jgi:hypothetical protein
VAELDSIRIVVCRVQIRENFAPSSYFIIFSLPNIYMQIRPGGMVDIYIESRPKSPRQHRRQVDSAAPSPTGLGSAIASRIQQRCLQHRAMDSTDSATASPTWLDNNITLVLMSPRKLHHRHASKEVTPWPTLPQQHHHQHDSATTSYHG